MNRFAVALAAVATLGGIGLGAAVHSAFQPHARPGYTWNVAVQDDGDMLVWQTGFASRLACFRRAAALNEQYQNTVFTCAEVFSRPLPFSLDGGQQETRHGHPARP